MSLKKLVEEITNPILQEGVNDPGILKAIFLAGGPGSGKTRVITERIKFLMKTGLKPSEILDCCGIVSLCWA